MEKTEILLVDDNASNLASLEGLLDADDLCFIRALSGEEALEAALRIRPALILLDVNMPGMDGFEVARLLRSTERTRRIPIIFVTATHREEQFTFRGFESGAVDYLFKPLSPVIVRSKVRVFVDLHRREIELERAIQKLSVLNEELESFSYSVSHDLRAPVRSVLGFTQVALDSLGDTAPEPARTSLQRVLGAGDRMNQLIDALLELARLARADLHRSKVNLSELAARICEELRQEHPGRRFDFRIGQNAWANGDPRLLDSVLRNLLGNACKFTSRRETAEIEFGVRQEEQGPVYFVRDNGVGFDMEHAQELFGTFQRLHSDRDFPGTGVGLATVKRIVSRHNGRIWAESAPGQGAVFHFTLSD